MTMYSLSVAKQLQKRSILGSDFKSYALPGLVKYSRSALDLIMWSRSKGSEAR